MDFNIFEILFQIDKINSNHFSEFNSFIRYSFCPLKSSVSGGVQNQLCFEYTEVLHCL
jgi:hypothetical protein